jgi:signal peptidase I
MDENIENYPLEEPTGETESPPQKTKWFRGLMDIVETLVISVALFLVINSITARIRVDGFSMVPTLQDGEFVIVNKLAYRFGAPHLGDVIVFRYPRDPRQEYIKRVVGLPGDHLMMQNGQLSVNGVEIVEPYIAASPRYNGEWFVPEDSLFVLGDNRNNSSDSHTWGQVPLENVIGKALFVYWPPEEWGTLTTASLSLLSH